MTLLLFADAGDGELYCFHSVFFFFIKTFKRAVLCSPQSWGDDIEISHMHPPSPPCTCTASLPSDGALVTTDELMFTCHHHPGSVVHIRFTLRVVCSVGLNKCAMACFYYVWNTKYFHCPPNPLCPAILSHPQCSSTTELFTFSMDLPFPECYSWNHAGCSLFRLASFT